METQENMIQTAIKAAQKPFIITAPNGMPIIANPCGNDTDWAYAKDETLLDKPLHKKGQPEFHDAKASSSLLRNTNRKVRRFLSMPTTKQEKSTSSQSLTVTQPYKQTGAILLHFSVRFRQHQQKTGSKTMLRK